MTGQGHFRGQSDFSWGQCPSGPTPRSATVSGDADFLFQQDFSTCPQCKKPLPSGLLTMILLCLIGQPTYLNPICNLWDIFKRKMRNSWSNNTDEQKCLSSATGWSLPCHSSDAGICANGALTKYWVHKWAYEELELFCFANISFWLILGNIQIFWDTRFFYFHEL